MAERERSTRPYPSATLLGEVQWGSVRKSRSIWVWELQGPQLGRLGKVWPSWRGVSSQVLAFLEFSHELINYSFSDKRGGRINCGPDSLPFAEDLVQCLAAVSA
jgi:hypothetical protein